MSLRVCGRKRSQMRTRRRSESRGMGPGESGRSALSSLGATRAGAGGMAAAEIDACNQVFFTRVIKWLRPHTEVGTIRKLPLDVLSARARSQATSPSRCASTTRRWASTRSKPRSETFSSWSRRLPGRKVGTQVGTHRIALEGGSGIVNNLNHWPRSSVG